MAVIYVSSACSEEMIGQIFEGKLTGVFQQSQKYNSLLAEGFAQNGQEVTMLSSRPINRQINPQLWFKTKREHTKGVTFHYLSFINCPVLRQLCIAFGIFWNILLSQNDRKDTFVICDGLNIAASAAAIAAAFLRGFLTVGIVTDVPCHTTSDKQALSQRINLGIMRLFRSYLLLTEAMNQLVNRKGRPYIVLEGHADQKMAKTENTLAGKAPQRICLYAGAVREIYGAKALVEGFLAAQLPDTELHIYGNGDYIPQLQILAAEHPNIRCMGVAPNSEVVQAELAATLLINPRPTHEEFTKYSFPSKNMEYMASGTPVLTTRLPGMPQDHAPYVYFIDREDAQGVKKALQDVLSQDDETLHRFGIAAKTFVLKEKNNVSQAAKVMTFVNSMQ